MAIIKRCCCWKSLRRGSFASGIYTLILYVVLLTAGVFHVNSVLESPELLTFSIFMLIFSGLSVISSIILLVGLCVDNRLLLLPWIGSVSIATLLDVVLSFYLITDVRENPLVVVLFVTDISFCALNVYCLLCVISQYQEYLAGRGRAGQRPTDQPIPTVRFHASAGGSHHKNVPTVSFQVAQNGTCSSGGLLMVPTSNSSSLSKSPHSTDLSSISEEPSYNDNSRKVSTDDTSVDEESGPKTTTLVVSGRSQSHGGFFRRRDVGGRGRVSDISHHAPVSPALLRPSDVEIRLEDDEPSQVLDHDEAGAEDQPLLRKSPNDNGNVKEISCSDAASKRSIPQSSGSSSIIPPSGDQQSSVSAEEPPA